MLAGVLSCWCRVYCTPKHRLGAACSTCVDPQHLATSNHQDSSQQTIDSNPPALHPCSPHTPIHPPALQPTHPPHTYVRLLAQALPSEAVLPTRLQHLELKELKDSVVQLTVLKVRGCDTLGGLWVCVYCGISACVPSSPHTAPCCTRTKAMQGLTPVADSVRACPLLLSHSVTRHPCCHTCLSHTNTTAPDKPQGRNPRGLCPGP